MGTLFSKTGIQYILSAKPYGLSLILYFTSTGIFEIMCTGILKLKDNLKNCLNSVYLKNCITYDNICNISFWIGIKSSTKGIWFALMHAFLNYVLETETFNSFSIWGILAWLMCICYSRIPLFIAINQVKLCNYCIYLQYILNATLFVNFINTKCITISTLIANTETHLRY